MLRFILIFSAAIVATALLHECGHAVAGLAQGLIVVPTPFKEYVLNPTLDWQPYRVLALGGPLGTLIAVAASGMWFLRRCSADFEAAFLGALLTPAAYSLRFLLVGRGHDGLEWMAAQDALGWAATGHALDGLLLAVVAAGAIAWGFVRRSQLRLAMIGRGVALFVFGLVVLVCGQVGNNAAFDHAFPNRTVAQVPPEVLASQK